MNKDEAAGGVSGAIESSPVTDKATPTVTVDAIATLLVEEKSPPQPHAIEQANAERQAQADKDVNGQAFNPAIHAVNADGSPRKTTRGAWALKRGRKGGPAPAPAAVSKGGIVIPGGTPQQSAKEQESRAAGVGAANLFFALCFGLGGPEWAPRIDEKAGVNEKLMLESATADYFASREWSDLPPGLALTAALAMYALPRLSMPQTKSRVSRVKMWIAGKYGAWKARRMARKRGFAETDVERADRAARAQYEKERANG